MPYYRIQLLFVLCFLISCTGSEESYSSLIDDLKEKIPRHEAAVSVHPASLTLPGFTKIHTIRNGERLLVSDSHHKVVRLVNRQGEILSTFGGEGSGPGEFQSISLSIRSGNENLYIWDARLKRLTEIGIQEHELQLLRTMAVQYPVQIHLVDLYESDAGIFGMFLKSASFFEPANEFLLYRLTDRFEPDELLYTLPGNERMRIIYSYFTFYTENDLADKSLWSFDEEWLYYGRSHEPGVNRFHLINGANEALPFPALKKRKATPEAASYYRTFYSDNVEGEVLDQYLSVIDNSKYFPLFKSFVASQEKLMIKLFFSNHEDHFDKQGYLLFLDLETGDANYLHTPRNFLGQTYQDGVMYGIGSQSRDEPFQIYRFDLDL